VGLNVVWGIGYCDWRFPRLTSFLKTNTVALSRLGYKGYLWCPCHLPILQLDSYKHEGVVKFTTKLKIKSIELLTAALLKIRLLGCYCCVVVSWRFEGSSAFIFRIRQSKEYCMGIFVDRTEFFSSLSHYCFLLSVAYQGGFGGSTPSLRNSEVLTKSNRIANLTENVIVPIPSC